MIINKNYICTSLILICIIYPLSSQILVFPPYGHSYGIRKAKQVHLSIFLPLRRFNDPQGIAAVKMKARDKPITEKDDDEVVVYGVNSGGHQLIYNTSMWGLDSYGKKGSGEGQFLFPKGIACDVYGNVYVVDAGNNRVVHLFNPKRKVAWVKAFNGKGKGDPGLNKPSQVGLDEMGRIYVTDTGNRRIVVFDSTGKILRKIVGDKNRPFVNGPTTIAVADGRYRWSKFRRERIIFCADKGGKRLWKMDFSGKVEKVINMPKGYTAFYGAIDYYHNFWVTDKENHCVLKFDRFLELLDIFGSYGKGDNQFIEPRGIGIWKRYGQTFIAEKGGAQYYWICTELKKVGFWQKQDTDTFCIHADLTEYSKVSLYNIKGADSTELIKRRYLYAGDTTYYFKNDKIEKLKSGSFIFRVEPTYSSYTYFHWDYPITLYPDEASVPNKRPKGVFVKRKKFLGKKKGLQELIAEWKKKEGE